jgi:hypothetical protein
VPVAPTLHVVFAVVCRNGVALWSTSAPAVAASPAHSSEISPIVIVPEPLVVTLIALVPVAHDGSSQIPASIAAVAREFPFVGVNQLSEVNVPPVPPVLLVIVTVVGEAVSPNAETYATRQLPAVVAVIENVAVVIAPD